MALASLTFKEIKARPVICKLTRPAVARIGAMTHRLPSTGLNPTRLVLRRSCEPPGHSPGARRTLQGVPPVGQPTLPALLWIPLRKRHER